MPHQVLQLNPILIPAINERLASRYTVHRYFEMPDGPAWLREQGGSIEAVITGGHTGISRAMLEQMPALKVVAVNGVGTDAVDLAYCRARGLAVTATLGALTEDVADLAIGLLIAAARNLCAGDRFVREGQWELNPQPSAIPLARRFSGMRVLTRFLQGHHPGPDGAISKLYWSEYHKEITELSLDIIGDGPERQFLEARVASTSGVRLLGRLDDEAVRAHYRSAAAVLLPGEEDFGIVPVEAQACGRPVVALGRGGATETVRHDETGLLVADDTVPAWAAALTAAAARTWDTPRIRQHAERFSHGRFRAEFRHAVDEVLAAPRGTRW